MPARRVRTRDPGLPRAVQTHRGRIYQLGRHRLMCGDATNPEDIAALMDGAQADMIFTDPPYNVGYIGRTPRKLTIQNDALSAEKFRRLLAGAFMRLNEHSRPGAPIYVCHPSRYTAEFMGTLAHAGWNIAQCLIWVKNHFSLGRADYHWKHEPILYGWKLGAAHPWYSDRKQTTIWECPKPSRNALHPTMKPIPLIARALTNSSNPGDIVLDTFGGSGSTLIAAEETGRTAYLMELDAGYCDVIRLRYANAPTSGAAHQP